MANRCFKAWILVSGLMLVFSTTAHANSITVDSSFRLVNALADGAGSQGIQTTSLGIVSQTFSLASGNATDPIHDSSITSQLSNISLLGNVLNINASGLVSQEVVNCCPDFARPGTVGDSIVSVSFTIDNWATYLATSLLISNIPSSLGSDAAFLVNISDGALFSDAGSQLGSNFSHSGLLAPGSYVYEVLATAFIQQGDQAILNGAYNASLVVTLVPEPSTLPLVFCSLMLLLVCFLRLSSLGPRERLGARSIH